MAAGLEVMLDDALLLVSELVTNAVVHAGTELELRIDIAPGQARIEVIDHGPGLPVRLGNPEDTREYGRGIFLLDALAQEWGTRHFAGGKSVWFVLGVTDRIVPRPTPLRLAERGAAPSPPVVSWLLGLPSDLEERLSPAQLIGELLHRARAARWTSSRAGCSRESVRDPASVDGRRLLTTRPVRPRTPRRSAG